MKNVGDHITWKGKNCELGGTVRKVEVRYLVDIDGSEQQVVVTEKELNTRK